VRCAHSSRDKKVFGLPSSAALRPYGCRSIAPGLPIAIESQWRGPKQQETTMATIGTFNAAGNGFTGVVKTLTLNVKTAKLVPNEKDNEKAPDFRIFAGTTDYAERSIMRSGVV
jgi:hypothetical protein